MSQKTENVLLKTAGRKKNSGPGNVVLTRTPVRLSFGGGGTDLASYYEEFGGFVLSTTIDKYFYSVIEKPPAPGIEITSADLDVSRKYTTTRPKAGDPLNLPLAVLDHLKIKSARIFLSSEVPQGSGLGLSGAVTVNLLHGLLTVQKKPADKKLLARLASRIEIEILKRPIGLQDQYACAFGGLNAITFSRNKVGIERLHLKKETLEKFQNNLMLFFTGRCRDSAKILQTQTKNTADKRSGVLESLHRIKELGLKMKTALLKNRPDEVGELLHASWLHKQKLAPGIALPSLETAYSAALKKGALGGKITGAGGGGFFVLYCPEKRRSAVRKALQAFGLEEVIFRFESEGSRVFFS
jgi:D-glycero-alpha-D-manno-heptose-7-phosphate kinase